MQTQPLALTDIIFLNADLSQYLDQIATFADDNKDAFGFLARQCYAEALERERIWIYTHQGNVVAYLFFGGRSSNITVKQLFVAEVARKCGLGKKLIEQLKTYALSNGFQTISARVAADLSANSFWEKMEFLVERQIKGGQTTKRLINVRLLELSGNFLWSSDVAERDEYAAFSIKRPLLSRPNYALDLNVFFDIIKSRIDAASAQLLVSSAMDSKLRLCVTHEFANELARHSVVGNDPVLQFARALPTLPKVPDSQLRSLIVDLRKLIFPEASRSQKRAVNDHSDLIHLAASIHHKAFGFITREKAILRCANTLRTQYGLEVVSPIDFLPETYDDQFASFAVSVAVGNADIRLAVFNENRRSDVEAFLSEVVGLPKQMIANVLEAGTSVTLRKRLISTCEDKVVGFASWTLETSLEPAVNCYLFVDEKKVESQLFVDHVLQKISTDLPNNNFCIIDVYTHSSQLMVVNTASEREFASLTRSTEWVTLQRLAYTGVLTKSRWAAFAQKLASERSITLNQKFPTFSEVTNTGVAIVVEGRTSSRPKKLLSFETRFSPLILLAEGRPGAIVPIQEVYANELLNLDVAQKSLLPGNEALLRLEKAYFGTAGFEKTFTSLGLVIFYISGTNKGLKAAVGLARVTFAGKRPASGVKEELSRLGVLDADKLARLTDKTGNIALFTFDNFVRFPSMVTYQELKKMNCVSGANLVSSQKLNYEQLVKIVDAGFGKSI
jgi:GNAT superfamily N-acetyltransferase